MLKFSPAPPNLIVRANGREYLVMGYAHGADCPIKVLCESDLTDGFQQVRLEKNETLDAWIKSIQPKKIGLTFREFESLSALHLSYGPSWEKEITDRGYEFKEDSK